MLKIWALVTVGLTAATALAAQSPGVPAYISAAQADPGRPVADVARDKDRKPGEVLAIAGVKPGDKVLDYWPGGGYFTRVLAKVVGPSGHVYDYVPTEIVHVERGDPVGSAQALAQAYPNVTAIVQPVAAIGAPEPLDLVFTAQNYHDLHTSITGYPDVAAFNRAVFKALKPGGVFLVIDHVAAEGTGYSASNTLHRIEAKTAAAEVEAAGFKLDGESAILRNPDDPHTALVFDPSIRGHTDQFLLKFTKPR